jgi:MFS family permease
MSAEPQTLREEFAAHWRVLIASTLGVAFGVSMFSFLISIFTDPLHASFGWSREAITNGAAGLLLGALTAPLVGLAIERFGVRPVVFVCGIATSACFVALSLLGPNIWGFYIALNVLFVVGGGTTPISFAWAISSWFRKGLGLALAITLSGVSVSGFILPPILSPIIAHQGWRAGFLFLAAVPFFTYLPIAWFWLRERARTGPVANPEAASGVSLGGALGSTRFWVMAAAIALVTMPALSIMSVLGPLLADRGFSPETAAWLISGLAVSVLIGRLIVGYLSDRLWAPGVAAIVLIVASAGPFLLRDAHGAVGQALFALVLIGLAQGAEINLLAFLIARYFGNRHFSSIYGAINVVFGMAIAAGVISFAMLYHADGNYDRALVVAGVCLIVSGLLFPLMGRYPQFSAPATA